MGTPLSPRPPTVRRSGRDRCSTGDLATAHIAHSCPSSRTGHTLSAMELLPVGPRRHVLPRPSPAGRPVARADLRPARAPVPRPAELRRPRCSTTSPPGTAPTGRACTSPALPTWSYAELLAAANRIAHVLVEDLGIVPGNRVLLRGPNNQWLSAAWFGVLKAGAVAGHHDAAAAHRRAADHPRDRPASTRRWSTTGSSRRSSRSASRCSPFGDDAWTERLAAKPATVRRRRRPPATTSACSPSPPAPPVGRRRRCTSTATCCRSARRSPATCCSPSADDVFTGTPPYAFTFGLGGVLLFPLHAGASTLLVEKATPGRARRPDRRARRDGLLHRAHGVQGDARRPGKTVPTLRKAVSAGEHLPKATWEAFREATGVEIIDGIGATEMLHIFISAAGADIRPGSTGRAVPGYAATVVDDDGQRAAARAAGRLAVKGPTGCRYLDDPRQAAYVQRRLEPHRRHVHPRRRGLLLVPGAQRRHDHQLGLQHRRARGRGGAAQAPGGRGVRGRRRPRRGARDAGQGVRRSSAGEVTRRPSCRTS